MHEKILDGKKVSSNIQTQLADEIISREKKGIPRPCIAVILIGNDPASAIYIKNKKESCKKIGIESLSYNLKESLLLLMVLYL